MFAPELAWVTGCNFRSKGALITLSSVQRLSLNLSIVKLSYHGCRGCLGRCRVPPGARLLVSPLVTRHFFFALCRGRLLVSSLALATHHCCMVPGTDGKSSTLKVSNHHEPNDRYHMNIRKRPVCPRFPSGFYALCSPCGFCSRMLA